MASTPVLLGSMTPNTSSSQPTTPPLTESDLSLIPCSIQPVGQPAAQPATASTSSPSSASAAAAAATAAATPRPHSHPLPVTIGRRPAVAAHTRKTERERARGRELEDPTKGVEATTPCACCAAQHARWERQGGSRGGEPEPRCLVARHPGAYNSYKCARCIERKTRCSFSIDQPGVPPPTPADAERDRPREAAKRRSRAAALKTLRERHAAASLSAPPHVTVPDTSGGGPPGAMSGGPGGPCAPK
ncbi:hypothetical protein SAMD00023353_11800110 [Rosellinia necatrix]|uniref:Uncharacterized protein n=1 Tax=Rosellinia necatrix TaxID=77044 RepID=A0A1S8AB74_ROSNE|nr:hypothetical protein SAMD00023353_11800110 [Rosellinia necatrix]